MSNITANHFTESQVFPKYVCDETLKKAAFVDGDGNTAIRVAVNDEEPDLTEILDRIGEKDTIKWDDSTETNPGSIISILKNIDSKLTTPVRPPTPPPQARALTKVIDLSFGTEVPFSSFQSFDLLNPDVSLSAGSYVLYIAPVGNYYEIIQYIRASGSETLDLTTIPQYSDPTDSKYYVATNMQLLGFAFEFTDSGSIEFSPCKGQSANFRPSYLVVSSNMCDFSPLFS